MCCLEIGRGNPQQRDTLGHCATHVWPGDEEHSFLEMWLPYCKPRKVSINTHDCNSRNSTFHAIFLEIYLLHSMSTREVYQNHLSTLSSLGIRLLMIHPANHPAIAWKLPATHYCWQKNTHDNEKSISYMCKLNWNAIDVNNNNPTPRRTTLVKMETRHWKWLLTGFHWILQTSHS